MLCNCPQFDITDNYGLWIDSKTQPDSVNAQDTCERAIDEIERAIDACCSGNREYSCSKCEARHAERDAIEEYLT